MSAPTTRTGPTESPARAPVRLRFTEEMKGFVGLGEDDPRQGAAQGRADGTRLGFHLTISMADVGRFVADPRHLGTARGWIDCEALGGRLAATGTFNLFVAAATGRRHMLYRLFFTDGVGHQLTLRGHKDVGDDPGADVWSDTTTLFVTLALGHVAEEQDADAQVTGAGVLRIRPQDFARQLTTFRVSGPSLASRGAGLRAFGGLFLGQLWQVYARRLPRLSRRNP